MSTQTAPFQRITWPASALGAFGGYRLYRRPSRAQAQAWKLLMDQFGIYNTVTAGTIGGYPAANVQTNHREYRDYDAAWSIASGQAGDGYDYVVTACDSSGLESLVGVALQVMQKQTADQQPWAVNNGAPFLNFPLASVKLAVEGSDRLEANPVAGRDQVVVRGPIELPERVVNITAEFFARTGEYQVAPWEAAASSGLPMTILAPRGDRYVGGLGHPTSREHAATGLLDVSGRLIETQRDPVTTSDINVPCGLVLNGTSQCVTVPDNALIQPGTGNFSVMVCGIFANSGGTRNAFDKSSAGGFGWMLGSTGVANEFRFRVVGATTGTQVAETNAVWFDGNVHCAIGTFNSAGQFKLYRDDGAVAVASASASGFGSVTVANSMTIGAAQSGAALFMAMPSVNVAAYWQRELTAAEAQATARAALGYSGYRMAASPAVLIDLRDDRAWKGYGTALTDLSAIPPVLNGTIVGTPATVGRPWNLSLLEKLYA